MNLTLSWDLFIVMFFAIVISYSFIIGKMQSVKVIVSSYVAIIATQGIGNVLTRLIGDPQAAMQFMGVPLQFSVLAGAKICLFIFFVIVLCIRSGLTISFDKDKTSVTSMLFTGLYGFATAGLMLSTILTYVTGKGILDMSLTVAPSMLPLVESSQLMLLLVLNQDIWFTLPALLIIGASAIRTT